MILIVILSNPIEESVHRFFPDFDAAPTKPEPRIIGRHAGIEHHFVGVLGEQRGVGRHEKAPV